MKANRVIRTFLTLRNNGALFMGSVVIADVLSSESVEEPSPDGGFWIDPETGGLFVDPETGGLFVIP